jgi:hypothetical protein
MASFVNALLDSTQLKVFVRPVEDWNLLQRRHAGVILSQCRWVSVH